MYITDNGIDGTYILYKKVNYNSKGAHIKGLTNEKTYYAYIEYIDDNGNISRSEPVKLTPGK